MTNTYYLADLATQERLLAKQVYHMPQEMQWEAFKHLHKRVSRFYGYNNKYDGRGNLRPNPLFKG